MTRIQHGIAVLNDLKHEHSNIVWLLCNHKCRNEYSIFGISSNFQPLANNRIVCALIE